MLKTVKIQKENQDYKLEKNSKEKIPSVKKLNIEELKTEKDYIEGQDHIPEHEISEKLENSIDSNLQEKEQILVDESQTKNKNVLTLKPRESHLKEKISQMHFDENILSGINKGIEQQLQSVKNDIIEKNVSIGNSQKLVNKSFDFSTNNNLKRDNFDIKKKYKEIKDLKDEKDKLNRKLMQIIENENLLESKNNSDLLVEKNLREKIKKDVSKQKKEILDKIDLINAKMKLTMQNTEDINTKRISNLKAFITNFERDKEIVEIRAKKYLKEHRERNKNYYDNLNQLEEKLKKEISEKEKEEEENQKQYVLKLRKQAKDLEKKQSKRIEQKSLIYKPFINQKTDKTKNYLFQRQYQKFIQNEQKLLEKENNFRKNYMKHFSNEEIDEFNQKMDKKREEKKLISEAKSQKLLEEWKERKKTIPTYISPLHDKALEEITNEVLVEKARSDQRTILLDKKNNYSIEVRTGHVPQKNKTLEQKRLATISNLDPKRFLQNKDTLQHHKRKGRVLLKKADPNKPNKYDWLKLLNKSAENEVNIEEKLIKRPKNYMLSMSYGRSRNKLPNIKKDYLSEAKKNMKKSEEGEILYNIENGEEANEEDDNYVNASSRKWQRFITDNKDSSIVDNINKAKSKIQKMEYEALQNEQLLKSQDDVNKSAELNKKVSNLIIDSIQAKITLLKQMK